MPLYYNKECEHFASLIRQKYTLGIFFTFCDFVTYKREKVWYNEITKGQKEI